MWLIEQISRKQDANYARPAILRHLLCKYYPWILVLETRIYIKHDSERCQPQLTAASVSPEGGWRRNSSARVPLYHFPPEAIPAERWGRKYIINLPLLINFLVDSSQAALHPFPLFSPLPLCSIKAIWGFLGCFSINMSALSGFCGAERNVWVDVRFFGLWLHLKRYLKNTNIFLRAGWMVHNSPTFCPLSCSFMHLLDVVLQRTSFAARWEFFVNFRRHRFSNLFGKKIAPTGNPTAAY